MFYRRSRNKYGAVRTKVDGISFASQLEARAYIYLKLLLENNIITKLEQQVKYPIVIKGKKIFSYLLDFRATLPNGEYFYIEVKGKMLPIAKLKLKAVTAEYGITITIWKKIPSYPQLIHN